jgi:hypothetical protein
MPSRFSALLMSGTACLVLASPSFAIEPEEAADALLAVMTAGVGTEADYDEAVQEGSDVVIRGLTVTRGAVEAAESDGADGEEESGTGSGGEADGAEDGAGAEEGTVTFQEARIESPTDSDNGIFESPRITFTGATLEGNASGTFAGATLTDVRVLDPKTVPGNDPGEGMLFRTAELNDLSVTPEGKTAAVTVDRIFMETGDVVDNVPQSNKGSVENLTIPPEVFAGNNVGPQTIGYENVVLGMTWDGSRDLAARTVNVRDFTLSMQDGGEFSISAILGKLPAPSAMNDADASAKASEVEVHTITLRYDDNSLAGRILDYLAQQQGITRQAYADQIAAALPFMMAALNNPEFQNEVSTALGAFLKDPQSLTVKIEPPAPISATEIMSIAGSAPGTLPDRLNASVTANGN